MRTSHLAIKRRIEDEKSKLTDAEVFASGTYAAYLTDMAEAATKRYKRRMQVKCYWDEREDADVALTNNKTIGINAANFLTQSFPTRVLRSDSLIGMAGHEIGHMLYTDFIMSGVYANSLASGIFYPAEPTDLTTKEQINLAEIRQAYTDADKIAVSVILRCAMMIDNILEDVYIEARMCDAFPGVYRSGILLNNLRYPLLIPSITEQVAREDYEYSIVMNLMIQYCKTGDVNNLHDYSGPYLDALYDCIPTIDGSVYDDNGQARYAATNTLLIKLWPYLKSMVDKVKEDMKNGKGTADELLDALGEALGKQIADSADAPDGSTVPIPSKKKFKHDPAALDEEKGAIQDVVNYETGRIELEKTDSIDEGNGGGVTRNNDYTGAGYASSDADIARILNQVAEDKAYMLMDEELSDELQQEADSIRYGNVHKGVSVKINRMSVLPAGLVSQYAKVSAPLLLLSRRMQRQVTEVLKDKQEGGKLSGLLMGKRLDAKSYVRDDGKMFYNNKLPNEKVQLAVGLLIDESGSMSSNDRITVARAAAIVIYDFCRCLNIPVIVYGHSTEGEDVDLFAYAEFDTLDNKDKYRLMDMSSRAGNRDGAALRYVAERLSKRDEQARLLILISDGQPAAYGYGGTEAEADLRGIKREYTNKGITMFAAAIGDDKPNIERIYGDGFLDVTDLQKLPANLTNLIARYIKV